MDRKKKLETSLEGLFSRPQENQEESEPAPSAVKKIPEKLKTGNVTKETVSKAAVKPEPKETVKVIEPQVSEKKEAKIEPVTVETQIPTAPAVNKVEPVVVKPQPVQSAPVVETKKVEPSTAPGSQSEPEKTSQAAPQEVEQELVPVEEEIVFNSQTEENDIQLLVFEINQVNYGVEVGLVQTIIKPQPVYLVPGTPEYLKGLTNLRGDVVPVIDLRTRFDLPEQAVQKDTRFMVIKINEIMASLVVDKVNGVKTISNTLIEKPSGIVLDINNRYLTGMARLDEMIILILDLSQTINPKMSEIK